MKSDIELPSRYPEIARQLREEVISGQYGKDGRLPSESQLVRRFGVSRPTVARALAVLVQEGLIERRAGSGSYVKSGPRTAIRGNILALLIPNLASTEIFQLICGEIASLARIQDYSLVWGDSDHAHPQPDISTTRMEELCRNFVERNVSGVFFAPYELTEGAESANQAMAEMLREAGIPVVLLDRDWTGFPLRSDFDLVGIDNFAGGFMLGEHLLKLGCKHIHFVSRPGSASTVGARMAGVSEALARHQIRTDAGWKRVGSLDDRKFIRSLTGPIQPDAYVCANDHTAAMLMRELHKARIRVPEDVRVVGFDDVKYATLVSPPLTTIRQPCRQIAQVAFRAMMDRLSDPTLPARKLALAPRLVIRDSCGAYLPRKND